jgi:hypothetical protein
LTPVHHASWQCPLTIVATLNQNNLPIRQNWDDARTCDRMAKYNPHDCFYKLPCSTHLMRRLSLPGNGLLTDCYDRRYWCKFGKFSDKPQQQGAALVFLDGNTWPPWLSIAQEDSAISAWDGADWIGRPMQTNKARSKTNHWKHRDRRKF